MSEGIRNWSLPPLVDEWRPPYLPQLSRYLNYYYLTKPAEVIYTNARDDARLRLAQGLGYTGGVSRTALVVSRSAQSEGISTDPKVGIGDVLIYRLVAEKSRKTLPEGAGMITRPQNGRNYQTEELVKPIRRLVVNRFPTLESAIQSMVVMSEENSAQSNQVRSGYQRALALWQEFELLQTKLALTKNLTEETISGWKTQSLGLLAEVFKADPSNPDLVKVQKVLSTYNLRDRLGRVNPLVLQSKLDAGSSAISRRFLQIDRNQGKANITLEHLLSHRQFTRDNILRFMVQTRAVEQSNILDGTTQVGESKIIQTQRLLAGYNQNLLANVQANPYLQIILEVSNDLDLLNQDGISRNFKQETGVNLNVPPTFRSAIFQGNLPLAKQIMLLAQSRLSKVYNRYKKLAEPS